jgi:hypothetical protein
MTTTATDTTAPVAPPTSRFESQLLQLVGEPFLFIRRSYGDELVLHFGDRVLGPARRTKNGEFRYEYGTYSLHLRGSAGVIKSGATAAYFGSGPEAEVLKLLGEPTRRANVVTDPPISTGARVTAVNPFPFDRPPVKGIGLRVDLSDGSTVVVVPSPDEPPESVPEGTTLYEIADWELHTPHGSLQVGPGLKWHLAPALEGITPESRKTNDSAAT